MTKPIPTPQRAAQPRRTNEAGRAIIKEHEGLRLTAYLCPANKWTIGYGHTGLMPDGSPVGAGKTITEEEADALLSADLSEAEDAVARCLGVTVGSNAFSALVSFTFNVGAPALRTSTLLKLLNVGDTTRAAAEFPRWKYGGGRVLPGLVKRRAAEQALFLAPDEGL